MRGRLTAGAPFPLGATPDPHGTNFALASEHAERVELCLFDAAGERETARIGLRERTGAAWHGHVAGITAGQRYGYRVYGPFDPARGHRFNHHKLLIDPYAKAIDRPFRLAPSMFGHVRGDPRGDLSFDTTDSAPDMPKATVVAAGSSPAPAGSRAPWQDTIIYELHVKGFTRLHSGVPEKLRGTLPGLAQPAALDHLVKLGVTTIELMPLAAFIDERHLPPLGLSNYWGYNPVTFLAPDPRFLAAGLHDVRDAIARIHEAGIEVILDVVFNHSGESDELGPTICYRGIDNATYYRLKEGEPRLYDNVTGCGNVLAVERPPVLRLIMDAMRHWVTEFGVDGFRFDLATTLARGKEGFDPNGPFLAALRQDPLLSQLKLIAEPWDVGPGGYQGGAFPAGIAEWNDKFRDDVRRFWRGSSNGVASLASRLSGSSDRFNRNGRKPSDSINHVTAHDGFSLADLVSYQRKHNDTNGEHNTDGTDENHSWNHGAEGRTDDPKILAARSADARALLATLLLSRGTPMLRSGDELGQSQNGNNNAYAQDNATTWIDWVAASQFADLTAFVQRLIAVRRQHPALRRNRFLEGRPIDGARMSDATWRRDDGAKMSEADWHDSTRRFVGLELFEPTEAHGESDDHVLVLVNGGDALTVALPSASGAWRVILDSSDASAVEFGTGVSIEVPARSVMLLTDDAAAPPQEDPAKLERLVGLAGIQPKHRDANGHEHIVSADTKRALLAAMGIAAATPRDVRDSLRAIEEEPWRGSVQTFVLSTAGRPLALDLIVDRANGARIAEATITLETGERHALHIRPSAGELTNVGRTGGQVRERWRVQTSFDLPIGLHRLAIGKESATIAIAPPRAWQPEALAGGHKRWGLAVNLYSARTERDWGMGDFSTLREIAEQVGRRGGAMVGINPLHALFPDKPDRASPYYPSDRRFLEPAYIDPTSLPGFRDLADSDPEFARLERHAATLREGALIDYRAVFALKRRAFARIWDHLRKVRLPSALGAEFQRFVAEGGKSLARFAEFQRAGAGGAESEIEFHMFLQWWADRSLAAATAGTNLSVGLYRDLAIGPAPDGTEIVTGRDWFAGGVSVGAPPDPYSDVGQVWGVPPHNPRAVARAQFQPWIELVRANMRHAGALRLDHVMGLERLLWVPDGATANEGAYVLNDAQALLAVLAIESHRQKCMVVGEDLGTVPSGFRERMELAGLFSLRVMLFERDRTAFRPADHYPAQSIASFGTHDLVPLQGWWRRHRETPDGPALLQATGFEGADEPQQVSVAVHRFLGGSNSKIALAQLDDIAGEVTAINVPGTTTTHPNWRRKMASTVEEIFASNETSAAIEALAQQRSGD